MMTAGLGKTVGVVGATGGLSGRRLGGSGGPGGSTGVTGGAGYVFMWFRCGTWALVKPHDDTTVLNQTENP